MLYQNRLGHCRDVWTICQDTDLVFDDTVRDDVRRVRDDQFSGPFHPAGSPELGMPAKPIDGNTDRGQDTCRRGRIFLYNEFANGFEIVERGCPPNDLHTNSRFLRLWPRQLAISAPGLNPLHDLFVRYGGTARFILRQCRFNMLDLPSVQIDVCLNSLARQMRGA